MEEALESRNTQIFAEQIRLEVIKALGKLGFGHVGGSMSIAETIAVLYDGELKCDPKNPEWEKRDWLVMSKGHAGPALYAALGLRGFFPIEDILTINTPHTRFPSHCDRNLTTGVDMTTGSLGQGMSTALGVAYGHKLDKKDNTVYLILGDGECDEGQIWEGALFAAHYGLDNVIAFVDVNRQQLDGYTRDVMDIGDLGERFAAFGWHVQEIDGGDVAAIRKAVRKAKKTVGKPHMIVLNTVKGRGCPFAEGKVPNHHMVVSKEDAEEAVAATQARIAALRGEVSK